MYGCMYVYVHGRMGHGCMRVYGCMCVCAYVCVCMDVCVGVCVSAYGVWLQGSVGVCVYVCCVSV